MNLLTIKIRRSEENQHFLVISNQNAGIPLPFDGTTLNLKSANYPQITGNTFYLWGSSIDRRNDELKVNKERRELIVRCLIEYSSHYGYYFHIKQSITHVELCVGTDENPGIGYERYSDYNINNSFVSLQSKLNGVVKINSFQPLTNNGTTGIDAMTEKKKKSVKETLYSCSTCKKDKLVASKMEAIDMCKKCFDAIPKCHICKKKQGTLKEYNDASMGKIQICNRCYKLDNCLGCKKEGLVLLFKPVISIRSDGKDDCKTSSHCPKCAEKLTICKHCSYNYDNSLYSICPCRIPKTFKQMIYPYNENVLNHLPLDEGTKELFGLEVEVGVHVKNRHKYQEVHQHTTEIIKQQAIMLYDSSIDYIDKNNGIENQFKGFEIVTRPLTYKNMLSFIKHLANNRHPLTRCWEVGTTGIHIHVNKELLSNIDIGKILVFINDKKNRKFIKMIAKREDGKYAKFVPRTMADYNDTSHECHYYAINTNKPHTIEFRIFRGTLNEKTLISYLQFVKSVIEFVKSNGVNNLKYTDYVDWLLNQTNNYSELIGRVRSEDLETINEEGQI